MNESIMFMFYTYGWLMYLATGMMFVFLFARRDVKLVKNFYPAILVFSAVQFFIMIGMPYLLLLGRLDWKQDFEILLTIWCTVFVLYIARKVISYKI